MKSENDIEYDAFISYSHKGDRDLARSVESTLRTFGRKWYQVRGVRTYRDETNLAAEPQFWPKIQAAVRQSRYLVLLASPDSVRSVYVPQEVEIALEQRGADAVCIALTAGVMAGVDPITAEDMFGRQDGAISRPVWELLQKYEYNPLVVDLRDYRAMPDPVRRRDKEFLSNIAALAAKVLGFPDKEAVWGEYYSALRRRTAFLAGVAGALLCLIGILGVLYSAEKKATRLAESRAEAAEARRELPKELNAALRRAAAAYRVDASLEAKVALLDALGRAARIVRYSPCPLGESGGVVAFSTEKEPAIAFSCNAPPGHGAITVIDSNGTTRLRRMKGIGGDIWTLAFKDADTLVFKDSISPALLHVSSDRIERIPAVTVDLPPSDALEVHTVPSSCMQSQPESVRMGSATHSEVAQLTAYNTEANEVVLDDDSGSPCPLLYGNTHNFRLAFSPDGLHLTAIGAIRDSDSLHGLILWRLSDFHPLATRLMSKDSSLEVPPVLGLSQSGLSWACARCRGKLFWDGAEVALPEGFPVKSITAIAVSDDRKELAVGTADGRIARIGQSTPLPVFATGIAPGEPIQQVWYVGGEVRAYSARGWFAAWAPGMRDLQILRRASGEVDYCEVTRFSGRGAVIVTRPTEGPPTVATYDAKGDSTGVVAMPEAVDGCRSLSYAGDASTGVILTLSHGPLYVITPRNSSPVSPWPNPVRDLSGLTPQLSLGRMSAAGDLLATVTDSGSVVFLAVPERRFRGELVVPGILSIELADNGKRLLTYSDKSGLLSWNLDTDSWPALALRIAGEEPVSAEEPR